MNANYFCNLNLNRLVTATAEKYHNVCFMVHFPYSRSFFQLYSVCCKGINKISQNMIYRKGTYDCLLSVESAYENFYTLHKQAYKHRNWNTCWLNHHWWINCQWKSCGCEHPYMWKSQKRHKWAHSMNIVTITAKYLWHLYSVCWWHDPSLAGKQ